MAARHACWCLTSTSGRAPSGFEACAWSITMNRASGSRPLSLRYRCRSGLSPGCPVVRRSRCQRTCFMLLRDFPEAILFSCSSPATPRLAGRGAFWQRKAFWLPCSCARWRSTGNPLFPSSFHAGAASRLYSGCAPLPRSRPGAECLRSRTGRSRRSAHAPADSPYPLDLRAVVSQELPRQS